MKINRRARQLAFFLVVMSLTGSLSAAFGRRLFHRWGCPPPSICAQPVPAPVTIKVDRKLLDGFYFVVYTKDAMGNSTILDRYSTLTETMEVIQRFWADGDNSVYFQRLKE